MSVFDTIFCELTCPYCGFHGSFEIDVRFDNADLNTYRVGEHINEANGKLNIANFTIDGYTECLNCNKDFFVDIKVEEKIIKCIKINTLKKGYL